MKIVIVDDEIYIIEMLKSLIEWDSLGVTLAGVATDGISAEELIDSVCPDIVITDIRIPGFDGLELIRRCRQKNMQMQFIIISGFRQFEYARNAIRYGVKEYLLKPIKKSELNTAIKGLAAQISENSKRAKFLERQNSLLTFSQSRLQSEFMETLVENPGLLDRPLGDINRDFMLAFKEGMFRVAVCKIDVDSGTDSGAGDYFVDSLKEKIVSDISEAAAPFCHTVLYTGKTMRIYFLLNYAPENRDALNNAVSGAFSSLHKYAAKFEAIDVSFGFGDEVSGPCGLAESANGAENAVRQRIVCGCNHILHPVYASFPDPSEVFTITEQRLMKKNIECFDLKALEQQCQTFFTQAELLDIKNALFFWELCRGILACFQNALISMRLAEEDERAKAAGGLENLLDNCSGLRRFRKCFIEFITGQLQKYYDIEDSSENVAVIIAKKYIANHYADKILLKDIAEQVYLNPVYFSICFKRDTGLNFVDYLNEYRIEKAKEKLKTVHYSISEIAESVGLPNVRYFSKTFKRYVGLSPAEYRKRYGSLGI
ncbi:response regulator transcription factor [Christensenella intestinihominis]|uniref:response regulator transcription factor n=1 Tax=Christensenella intestinihominis TaxID=1851429 RepID=UPI000835360E|nr:response regulator [Christensenella intestinihominis]